MKRPRLLASLQGYRRSWLPADVLAGLTLVAIAVPEQMATAHLANMPTVTGFFAFIAGSCTFALLGRHPLLSVGADSTIAPVFAAGVASVAAVGTAGYPRLVSAVALSCGALLVAVGLLRLGWVADFLPLPVITGLLSGIGAEILVKQLPTVLGLAGGGTTSLGRLEKLAAQLHATNAWSAAIAGGVLALVLVAEKLDRRVPGALVGVVAATLLVALAGLASHGVPTVGVVQGGLPHLGLPPVGLGQLGRLAGTAVTVTFLCVVQTSATARASLVGGDRGGGRAGTSRARPADFDTDLIAIGVGSALAGLAGSFPVNASPPRTAVVAAAGGRSQVAGLTAVASVAAIVAFATSLLRDVPEAALGAVLIFVATRLFRLHELRRIAEYSRGELGLALVTFAVVVLIGVEQGVVAAVLLALAQRTWASARPRDAVMGRQPGTDHWVDIATGQPAEQVPGVLVYLLYAPLWYGNAAYVCERVRGLAAAASPSPLKVFVFDANGVSDVDYTGAKALAELVADLRAAGTLLGLARSSHLVHHDLKHAGLLQALGSDCVFDNVETAVRELTARL